LISSLSVRGCTINEESDSLKRGWVRKRKKRRKLGKQSGSPCSQVQRHIIRGLCIFLGMDIQQVPV